MEAEHNPRPVVEEAVRSGGRSSRAPSRIPSSIPGHHRPPRWHAAAEAISRAYFDVSYGLLAGSEAGRRLLRQTSDGDEPVHGYFTRDDREALLADLDPRPGQRLLDLGSGVGGVALEVRRRTGAEAHSLVAAGLNGVSDEKIAAIWEFRTSPLSCHLTPLRRPS